MEQSTEFEKPTVSAADNRPKNGNGLAIVTIVACVVAACSIGLGAYGIIQSTQKDDRISELETQLANIKSEIHNGINNNEDATRDNTESEIHSNIENAEDDTADDSTVLDFDFDAMLASLKSSMRNSDMVPIMAKCTNYENVKGEPVSDCGYTALPESTIEKVIKKLKSAESVDKEISYSFIGVAPAVTYYVSVNDVNNPDKILEQRIFSLNYSHENNILLVSFDKKGYAFHFSDSKEIDSFIESLV